MVGEDTELIEKLGGKDPCPCGSGRRFQPVLPSERPVRRHDGPLLRP
ncbi:SEC-C metal-binding domain-containing protein [Kibdelosporangium aridum]